MWLAGCNPCHQKKELIFIDIKGIANQNTNCHRAYEIGHEMMTGILVVEFGSLPFKQNNKVLSLSAVNISFTFNKFSLSINPLLLYQRICIAKNSETGLKHFLAYELVPFSLSLYSEEEMRKETKSLLYNAFEPLTENLQPVSHMFNFSMSQLFEKSARISSNFQIRTLA